MTIRTLLNKHKKEWFPWIKDFSSEHDHIRYEKNVNKLSWLFWFWMHPSAYSLIMKGTNVIAVCMFGPFTIYLIFKGIYIFSVITGFVAIVNALQLKQKLEQKQVYEHMTFYDLWLKDFDDNDIETAAKEFGVDKKLIEAKLK